MDQINTRSENSEFEITWDDNCSVGGSVALPLPLVVYVVVFVSFLFLKP